MNTIEPFRLVVPHPYFAEILEHARAELPAECCGVLAGRIDPDSGAGSVLGMYRLVNELHSPTEFLSEPRSLLAAHKQMRASGLDMLAVYHSHPTSHPVPSRRDLEHHYYGPAVISMIIGLAGEHPEVRCWWLEETTYREAEWQVEAGG